MPQAGNYFNTNEVPVQSVCLKFCQNIHNVFHFFCLLPKSAIDFVCLYQYEIVTLREAWPNVLCSCFTGLKILAVI